MRREGVRDGREEGGVSGRDLVNTLDMKCAKD